LGRQFALVAKLARQALLGEYGHGAYGFARRDGLFIEHPFALRRAAIRQRQVQAAPGFIQVKPLVEGNPIDLPMIAFRFGLNRFGALFRIIGGLFFG
jgi:hypothetical protein